MKRPETKPIAAGERIVHPDLGAGVVRRLRRGGRALLVSFDSNPKLLLEVRAHEVRPELPASSAAEPPQSTAAQPARRPLPVAPPAPFRRLLAEAQARPQSDVAAMTLEALRLGVVPHTDLEPSTVGRDAELALVRADLAQTRQSGAARVFLGDYGTGKTHMLEIIEREALRAGFLVGRATLDAEYVMPSHPMRIYRAAVTSLVYPDRNGTAAPGLEPLLRKGAADEALLAEVDCGRTGFGSHLYLRPALHYFAALDQLDDPVPRDLLLDWLAGQRAEGNQELDAALRALARRFGSFRSGPTVYSLKDFQPWAHVYAYLLGGLSVLARRVGYQGLVVQLDEAENFDLLGSAARAFAENLFSCLVLAALGPDGVSFAESAISKGGFAPQKRLPNMFARQQHLYVVSAMTPSTAGEELLRRLVPGPCFTELEPLSQQCYHELSRRVATIFEAAYPEMRLGERLSRPLGDVLWTLMSHHHIASPRDATKLTVEFLDLLRLRHDALESFFADVKRAIG